MVEFRKAEEDLQVNKNYVLEMHRGSPSSILGAFQYFSNLRNIMLCGLNLFAIHG